MSPVGLGDLLSRLPEANEPNLLVGFESSDDAAVYRLSDEVALVLTADIITPPVDDPRLFGEIAAANALSDIFAMGGKPLVCLNLVGFPAGKLDQEMLQEIVNGSLGKITEAGAVLGGGHSTEDEEPKFGLSVAGIVHPDEIWTNSGAEPLDALILTKPIGSGVLFNANQKGWVSKAAMNACLEVITTLNQTAALVMRDFPVHAVTDVTGFGLAGHGFEMAEGSEAALRIEIGSVPVMDESLAMYERGMSTGVNETNRRLVAEKTRFERTVPRWHEEIFMDPQTSGGLLVSVPEAQANKLVAALREAGVGAARRIGTVEPYDGQDRLIFT